MKNLILLMILLFVPLASFANSNSKIYDYEINSANGEKLDLNQFKGKPLLVVNIATKCGYTGQLDELEKLNQKYQKLGFNVLGIPSNDFASQTPENDEDVVKFCQLKYGVTFPITKKAVVVSESKHPLIKHIVFLSGGSEIGWNFEKFLFDKNGNFVKRFGSSVTPDSKDIISEIDKVIK